MKKYFKLIICFALVAAISVGATLAYLQANVGTKTNNFQSSKKISGELLEPKWGLADNEHWDYLPGESHAKDPQIKLNNDSVNAYVAMKVEFIGENEQNISYDDFIKKYATILSNSKNNSKFNLDDWDLITTKDEPRNDQSKFFVYKDEVIAGQSTTTLFDEVSVNTEIGSQVSNELPSFQIKLTGYAVQSSYNTLDGAKKQLFEMAY